MPQNVSPKKAAFLAAFRECGTVSGAADAVGINRKTHYRWLDDDDYRADFEKTQRLSAAALEAEARRRALDGVQEPVFYEGKIVGHRQKHSDTLLIFLLKANNPGKFGDKVQQTHKGSGEIVIQHEADWYGNSGKLIKQALDAIEGDERFERLAEEMALEEYGGRQSPGASPSIN